MPKSKKINRITFLRAEEIKKNKIFLFCRNERELINLKTKNLVKLHGQSLNRIIVQKHGES
ncbi:hypothetical protein A7Q09_06830 [Methylacidiphilum sp. Yel]|nr:hypothetical protein A7Q09_06830 [Methylacidiphilum sp. Yel]